VVFKQAIQANSAWPSRCIYGAVIIGCSYWHRWEEMASSA